MKKKSSKFFENHDKKIIITIIDGLDEELKLINEWNSLIFNNPSIYFGFIFNMPNIDNIKDKEEIEKLYNIFIEGSKKAKSKIIVKIIGRDPKNNHNNPLSSFLIALIGKLEIYQIKSEILLIMNLNL